MLKRPIKYTDYNDQQQTEIFYFNISKPELVDQEVRFAGGFVAMIERIIESENKAELVHWFKQLIIMAIGQKSDDGKRFIKSDIIREQFEQSAAYEALYMELATDADAGAAFVRAILPKDLVNDVNESMRKNPELPTPPVHPTSPPTTLPSTAHTP